MENKTEKNATIQLEEWRYLPTIEDRRSVKYGDTIEHYSPHSGKRRGVVKAFSRCGIRVLWGNGDTRKDETCIFNKWRLLKRS